jgi:predicted GH43/DUF377 family glycosyl hydrolase
MKVSEVGNPSESGSLLYRILALRVRADDQRTILLPFVHGHPNQVRSVLEYLQKLDEAQVQAQWKMVLAGFGERHRRLTDRLMANYQTAARTANLRLEGAERQLLAGAYFTMEYAFQGAALFNPSLVAHPDQSGMKEGSLRFIMSLRAVGEGHISSVVFCTGQIDGKGNFAIDPLGKYISPAPIRPDRQFQRALFQKKLSEMGVEAGWTERLLGLLPEVFTVRQLEETITRIRNDPKINDLNAVAQQTMESALWLARSNYQVQMPADSTVSDLLIFPHSENESRGIEDMRLVQFRDNGNVEYFGTYTAYDGAHVLPMLMGTTDFRTISIHTLNGQCAQNKGMALFPRKIKGHYAMCSRIDGRNLYLMYSDLVHFWETATVLLEPKYPWEFRLMGNCGSALETKEGWLLITHGVGPMRQYSIGAALLDLEDPLKLRGRLKEPLIMPTEDARAGYVPNVVYSCGGLIWGEKLYLPYGIADEHTAIAEIQLPGLLEQIIRDGT